MWIVPGLHSSKGFLLAGATLQGWWVSFSLQWFLSQSAGSRLCRVQS